TRSYSDIARQIGRPAAVRAVARANGANQIAIMVPCHRVIGADGALTGYGGGLWRKQRLIEIERQLRQAKEETAT
ncbi:MAG: methylated-DNA--[protein]-cysteine S-methyltransferase, partial [Alphaproteobacteria bacterium]